MQALEDTGIDGAFYAYRVRNQEEIFPWDHLSSGVDRKFLLKKQVSTKGITTDDCPCKLYRLWRLPYPIVDNHLQRGD